MLREVGRLEASLKAAPTEKKLAFLHYPPIFQKYECPEILRLLKEHEVRLCLLWAYPRQKVVRRCLQRLARRDGI